MVAKKDIISVVPSHLIVPSSIKHNLLGLRFGRLLIQGYSHSSKGETYWHTLCDCGNQTLTTSHQVRRKRFPTKSCGCLHKEQLKATQERRTKHGMSRALLYKELYSRWRGMIQRCYNMKSPGYRIYGARGITVCERWRNSFKDFFEDMGFPEVGQSLERKDNNGPYSPENCIWADKRTQANNRRTNRLLFYKDEQHTIAEWGRILGISRLTITTRLWVGWSVEKALSTPVYTNDKTSDDYWEKVEQRNSTKKNAVFLTYKGKTKYIRAWARELGIKHDTIARRIKNGWSINDALEKPVRT